MKNVFWMVLMIVLPLTGTGVHASGNPASTPEKKILVVYFSHSGNTRVMAEMIQEMTGGELFEIVPVKAYPREYKLVLDQAEKEINTGFKPELQNDVGDIRKYDVVFVGSPNWWNTIAPPVTSFLSGVELEGKTVVPFMTHGGGRMGRSESDIRLLFPKTTILNGFPVAGSRVRDARKDVMEWLRKIGFLN